jgi:hypothetical protein
VPNAEKEEKAANLGQIYGKTLLRFWTKTYLGTQIYAIDDVRWVTGRDRAEEVHGTSICAPHVF